MRVIRTNSKNSDFQQLVTLLDKDLAIRDGDEHEFYNQFNGIDALTQVVVCFEGNSAVGCGAIKPFENDAVEIKRMYTLPDYRGKGVGKSVLNELKAWAKELDYRRAVLETGVRQPEAISLYTSQGFERIPNYGQYESMKNSLCFEKVLK